MPDYTLSAKATADTSSFEKGMKKAEGSLSSFEAKCSSVSVAAGTIMGNLATKGIGAILSSVDSAVSRVDALNQYPKVMKNLGYEADVAEGSISRMSDGIEGLPTTLDDIVGYTQALTLSLGDLDKSTDVAIGLNDGFINFGASADQVQSSIVQLNQMITTGKYDMQSWNAINQSAPGYLDAIARSMMGDAAKAGDLREALNSGRITTEDFLNQIVLLDKEGSGNIKAFSETARDAVGGIETSADNAKTAIVKNVANIIDAVNKDGTIVEFFDGAKSAINVFGQEALPVAESFGDVLRGIGSNQTFQELTTEVGEFGLAAVDAFGGVLDSVDGYISDLNTAHDSTQSLYDAIAYGEGGDLDASFWGQIREGVAGYSKDLTEAAANARGCLQSQAELANGIKDKWKGIASDSASLQTYTDAIERLASKVEEGGEAATLNAAEQAELNAALEGYNEIAGTAFAVVDGAKGKLDVSTDALRENTEAWIENAKAQAAQEAYVELYKQQIDNERQLAEVRAELNSADEGTGLWLGDFAIYADEASVKYHELTTKAQELEEAMASNATAQDYYLSVLSAVGVGADVAAQKLESIGISTNGLAQAFQDAGVTEAEFASLSDSILQQVASSYDSRINGINERLQRFATEATAEGEAAGSGWADRLRATADKAVSAAADISSRTVEEIRRAASDLGVQGEEAIAVFAAAISDGASDTEAAAIANAEQAAAGLEGADTETSGQYFTQGFANGILSGQYLSDAAAAAIVNSALAKLRATGGEGSPWKTTIKSGEFAAQGLAVGMRNASSEPESEAKSLAKSTVEPLGSVQSSTWTYGYHSAINFAKGFKDGSSGISQAAGDAEAELRAHMDAMIASYRKRSKEAKEISSDIADMMWGSVLQQADSMPRTKLGTGAVYDAMKAITGAGMTLDQYIEKTNEWDAKLAKGMDSWSDSTREQYEEWRQVVGGISVSIDELKSKWSLAVVKDDINTGQDAADELAGALTKLRGCGVAFSEEFVDAFANGSDDYKAVLKDMASWTTSDIQTMVDAFDDLRRAERLQELEQYSLWVNSLKTMNGEAQDVRDWMIDYRYTVLDVRKALYSDAGLSGAFEAAGVSAEGFALDLQSLEVTMDEFVSYSETFTQSVSNGFSRMTSFGKTSLADWEYNLRNNMAEAQAWAANLQSVFSKVNGLDIDADAFRKAVYEGGFEQWGAVIADMAGKSASEIADIINLYNDSIFEGQQSALEAFRSISPGEEFVQAVIDSFAEGQDVLDLNMAEAAAGGAGAMLTKRGEFVNVGAALIDGASEGVMSRAAALAAAAAAVVSQAIAAAKAEADIHSPSGVMDEEFGQMFVLGGVRGIDKTAKMLEQSARRAAFNALDTAQMAAGDFRLEIPMTEPSFDVSNPRYRTAAPGPEGLSAGDAYYYGDVIINATIREDADIDKLISKINHVQNKEARSRGWR